MPEYHEKAKNRWLALTVPATEYYEDIVASFLVELSGTGVEFSEKGVTTYLPLDEKLTFKLAELDNFLRKLMGDNIDEQRLQWYGKVVYEEDWSESWKAYFKPTRIGKRIVVSPSWEKYSAEGDEIVILVDPGRAFGVGTHPTTRMCVEAIEEFSRKKSKEGGESWSLCDVGCGTGILAIVAAKLGAEKVLAVDIDPVAVEVTVSNCHRNDVADRVEVVLGSVEKIKAKFSCVVANLTRKLLIDLASEFRDILLPGGELILSGILDSEMDEVNKVYRHIGYQLVSESRESEWGLLVYRLEKL